MVSRIMAIVAGLTLGSAAAVAQSSPHQDALISSYFSIWDQDGNVTPDNVAKLYAPRLIYYGHAMTREALLNDKRAFIRRWPDRRYGVEPGSAAKSCDATQDHCRLSATLVWRTRGSGRERMGRSRVTLDLARSDGFLKIVREGAVTLGRE
ncbi:hypothetical protein P7D22_07950 [Lichenihabitans sp. Uapishka_5]|uniref:hypothetical protein n=1 Tax=Lichenihabitans sp. Uapishka_5 TaxID=3037302 RepID=UPI0029E7D83F|nr:hypothetical protein [Lichenihabitans sp. Uapishka_5]MDX7951112.1 hypothetical protein [Lichenihabitans sp. Uapishka_5]